MVFMIKATDIAGFTTNNVVVSLIYLEHVYMNIIVSTQALSRPFLWFGKNNLVALKTKKDESFVLIS